MKPSDQDPHCFPLTLIEIEILKLYMIKIGEECNIEKYSAKLQATLEVIQIFLFVTSQSTFSTIFQLCPDRFSGGGGGGGHNAVTPVRMEPATPRS